ncbi:MAG: hypothetical protein ACTHU0_28630 [Kofleriaceae bacterium]
MQRALAAVLGLAIAGSCGKSRDEGAPSAPPPTGRAPQAPAPRAELRAFAELRGHAELIAGTGRAAVVVGDAHWYELDERGPASQPMIGAALGRTRAELGGELLELHLGRLPIVSGGEEHRERVVRLAPEPGAVELHGMLVQVATTAGGIDVWRSEHELRSELSAIDAAGARTELPPLPRIGPEPESRSPVSARACAAPKVREIAASGDQVLALVTECHPSAPVRIARYRWPGPTVEVRTLPPLGELGLEIDRLVVARDGTPILVGRRDGVVQIARVTAAGALEATPGPARVELVLDAEVADDGAVWTRTLGRAADGRDQLAIARDGAPVELASPAGHPLRPEGLALDDQLGVVVLALEGSSRWLLAERAPPGPPVQLR